MSQDRKKCWSIFNSFIRNNACFMKINKGLFLVLMEGRFIYFAFRLVKLKKKCNKRNHSCIENRKYLVLSHVSNFNLAFRKLAE